MDFVCLAQGPEVAMPTTTAGAIIFVVISVVGLFVWFVRHILTVTIPEQQKAHAETIKELTVTFAETNSEERRLCAEQFALVTQAINALTVSIREGRGEIISRINSHTTEEAARYRHDIYDAINRAVLTKEAYARMKQREAEREAENREREGDESGESNDRTD